MPNYAIYLTKENDGWYAIAGEVPVDFMVRVKVEFNKIYKVPRQHYFVDGKCLCGKYPSLPSDAYRENNPAGYDSECLKLVRKDYVVRALTLKEKGEAGDIAGAEAENVIDYKATAAKDHPESAHSGHS